jgi:hypothetical protein
MEMIQVNMYTVVSGFSLIAAAFCLYKVSVMHAGFQSELEQIRAELLSTSTGSVGVGKRLLELEKKFQGSLNKQDEFQQGYTPYSRATEMLSTGSDVNDVITHCGISRAEAELMQLMHRQMKRCGPLHKK